jgi:hypothetical protein
MILSPIRSNNCRSELVKSKNKIKRKPMKDFVREYIEQRIRDINNGTSHGRITLSDIFYDLRKPMQEVGWEPEGWNHPKQRRRQTVQDRYVKEVCDELGITRASIGIITGETGHMYFRTGRYSIGIDDLSQLKNNGTDILIIEKEGIAEQLKDLAAPYGIALIHGRGFLTEYASELSRLAHNTGGNIVILTDFDDSGITIALQMPSVPRIGIDFKTLRDLGLSDKLEELEEIYTPENHITHLRNEHPEIEGLQYLEKKRVEINAVTRYIGADRFWKWIISKLEGLFPNRNYNRAVYIPTAPDFRPGKLSELVEIVDRKITGVLTPLIEKRKRELDNYEGFIDDITVYEYEMHEEFQHKVGKHKDLEPLLKDISRLVGKYTSHSDRRATQRHDISRYSPFR